VLVSPAFTNNRRQSKEPAGSRASHPANSCMANEHRPDDALRMDVAETGRRTEVATSWAAGLQITTAIQRNVPRASRSLLQREEIAIAAAAYSTAITNVSVPVYAPGTWPVGGLIE
jgi:hypothetical protein